jgi:hypothetical protein
LIEIAVFAPIGVASTLRDMAPTFVNVFVGRGRTEIDRQRDVIERRVRTVRSTGEVALAFGLPLLRRKVEDRLRAAARVGGSDRPADPLADRPLDRGSRAERAERAERDQVAEVSRPRLHAVGSVGSGPDAGSGAANGAAHPAGRESEHLAIPGYDELAASQVVERLVGLSRVELDEVRRYEAAHRNRRTILGKIEQLATA